MLLFFSILTLLIICCNRLTSLWKNFVKLTWVFSRSFSMHVHHFQCLMVPVELPAMFRFMLVGKAEMSLWLLFLIVSKSVWDCNVFDHLICWIVYNVCISHIVWWCLLWGLLLVYAKSIGFFQCWCMHDLSCVFHVWCCAWFSSTQNITKS